MTKFNVTGAMGSSEADKAVGFLLSELYEIFDQPICEPKKFMKIDALYVVFLVSGRHKNYKSEGPENLKKIRGKNELIVYYAIPEERWDGIPVESLRTYMSEAIFECSKLLLEKAKKMKEIDSFDDVLTTIAIILSKFRAQKCT